MRLVVLASGHGSNLRALVQATREKNASMEVIGVVSDNADAPAIAFAQGEKIRTEIIALEAFAERTAWDRALSDCVATFHADLVVLAGFMRIVGASFLTAHAGKVINTHPSLLPAFPGKNAPQQALRQGVRISGCTVHVVDAGVDTGPIIAQAAVPVLPSDTPESLHARIQTAEHRLLAQVVTWIAQGHIQLVPELRLGDLPLSASDSLCCPPISFPRSESHSEKG